MRILQRIRLILPLFAPHYLSRDFPKQATQLRKLSVKRFKSKIPYLLIRGAYG